MEASADDLQFEAGAFTVSGSPDKQMAIQEIAFGAFTAHDLPDGMEPNLQEQVTFDPPNFISRLAPTCALSKSTKKLAMSNCSPMSPSTTAVPRSTP